MPPVKLSAVIITYNEEKNIGRCLESLKEVADEMVVVDSHSRDNTVDLALSFGARVVQNEFLGHIQQKNFALSTARYDHILSLDADECLSDELRNSINRTKSDWVADGYTMNRLSRYGARWIRFTKWYPDRKLRLWIRPKGTWGGENPHDKVLMQRGSVISHLKGDLLHYAYENASQMLEKVNRYTDIFARENRYLQSSSYFKIVYKTIASFVSNYILRRGIFGGYEGLAISYANATNSFFKYSKLLEANRSLDISVIEVEEGKTLPDLSGSSEYLIFRLPGQQNVTARHRAKAWKGRYLVGGGTSCWKEDLLKAAAADRVLSVESLQLALGKLGLQRVGV